MLLHSFSSLSLKSQVLYGCIAQLKGAVDGGGAAKSKD